MCADAGKRGKVEQSSLSPFAVVGMAKVEAHELALRIEGEEFGDVK
jgi:hypothetical protein